MLTLDDAEIARRLLHHLARAFDCANAAYAASPVRIQGGFDTAIFGFTLDHVPPDASHQIRIDDHRVSLAGGATIRHGGSTKSGRFLRRHG